MQRDQLRKYADLVVKVGANLQPGQNLVIGWGLRQVLPDHIEFARSLMDAGYAAGAKFVELAYGDEWWLRETFRQGNIDTLSERFKRQAEWIEHLADEGSAFISIPSSDPNLYRGVDAARVNEADRVIAAALRPFNDKRTNGDYQWTLASAPTKEWADVVFPDLAPTDRFEALWDAILASARADGNDPVSAWQMHVSDLHERRAYMNDLEIEELHYRAPGTDLRIRMPKGHYWTAASQDTPEGITFVANIPTEEVYSAPAKYGVNGTVTSTMPLNHNGTLIDGISLTFENGRIINYSAAHGQEALASIIETDEGSHYLGEVALVPADSPIAKRGLLFYNTLFDENASCHLAIGKAYPLIEGGRNLPQSEWEGHELNSSLKHVDFMIGSPSLNIDALTRSGTTVPLFRNGKWATSL